jgi:hypothetical protein
MAQRPLHSQMGSTFGFFQFQFKGAQHHELPLTKPLVKTVTTSRNGGRSNPLPSSKPGLIFVMYPEILLQKRIVLW